MSRAGTWPLPAQHRSPSLQAGDAQERHEEEEEQQQGGKAGAALSFPAPVSRQGGRRAGEQWWEGWNGQNRRKKHLL